MRHLLPLLAAIALPMMLAPAAALAPKAKVARPSGGATLSAADRAALKLAIASPTRTPANVARDKYRNPEKTLTFFGVRPTHTVVEIAPGGGWYTEILAPYLARGRYYAAGSERGLGGLAKLKADKPALYGKAMTTVFPAAPGTAAQPAGTADVVLTFRNVHNWMGGANPQAPAAFATAYAMLKPGGVLGVVEHRLPENAAAAREASSGYVKTSTVRRLAEAAGFRFAGASEVNANPRDTTDHPQGVWTLPPVLRLGDKDRAKYLAIGESDRMTLKFVKPR